MFEVMIWAGAAISVIGMGGIFWCIVRVVRARRAKLDDAAMHTVLQSVIPINMGAFFFSAIGLMLVAIGVILA